MLRTYSSAEARAGCARLCVGGVTTAVGLKSNRRGQSGSWRLRAARHVFRRPSCPSKRNPTSSSSWPMTSAGLTSAAITTASWAIARQHRPYRERGRELHRLLWPAELHRRPRGVHHRPATHPHRPDQGWNARRNAGPQAGRSDDCAVPRTIWATATSICRRCMASMSSSAISIT